ncbi:MAG: TIM barrel protein [Thermoguttaceae bacterium]|nr:TIM barrel protein [Thermoguttaceae bacterium]
MKNSLSRRTLFGATTAGFALWQFVKSIRPAAAQEEFVPLRGRLKQSVSRWCYNRIPLDVLCKFCSKLGIKSVELIGPKEWPVVKEHGLTCAMVSSGTPLTRGFNRRENHDWLVAHYERMIPMVAEAGFQNLICFSGNREGLDDETGLRNCEEGIKRLLPLCEKHNVVLVIELLNSKVDHPDYQCDRTRWAVELCKRIGSEKFKILYDIYHMQIMEGDLIRTIRENIQYIAHFHTGGNPGRNEIDETQEINYPAVMRAIADLGFTGYIGHEFVPKSPDPLAALERCARLCDV